MTGSRGQSPARRRGNLRRFFDAAAPVEWKRYAGAPNRLLRRVLRERFVLQYLPKASGVLVEAGPGPGRFTEFLRRATTGRMLALDLSRVSLQAARRRTPRVLRRSTVDWIQGAAENLPLRRCSVEAVVALGNVVSFAAREGPALLREFHRVLRPGGVLVADFASPVGSAQEFLVSGARRRFLRKVLRRPGYYMLDLVLDTGFQPFAPARMARWELRFYTVPEARTELTRAGFRVVDAMAVAPLAAHDERIAGPARKERRTWETLVRIEEKVGRRPGVLETGHGFLVAAVRR